MPISFGMPLMLWSLTTLAGMTAIYLLQMRSRRMPVSSMLLWGDDGRTSDHGRAIRRLRTPLLFLLAMLTLLLLAIGASEPLWPLEGRQPIIVILDDSFSMRAGEPSGDETDSGSPRRLALLELETLMHREKVDARVILAGRRPLLLSQRFSAIDPIESRWQCGEPMADIFSAIVLARQVGAGQRIVVLTDRSPDENLANSLTNIDWRAVGEPRSNYAIVSAVRRDDRDGGKALIEIGNFDIEPSTIHLTTRAGENVASSDELFEPGEIRRFTIPLPAGAGPLEIEIPDDSLELDNRAVLIRDAPAKIPVELSIENDELRKALRRAIEASGRAEITSVNPQLRFADSDVVQRDGCWDVILRQSELAQSILGPFVLDKNHELIEGVVLAGVVMSRDDQASMPGIPLISTDGVPLMSWRRLPGGERVTMQISPGKTTLLESVDFPILISNMLRWREHGLPEQCRPNVRVGDNVRVILARNREKCTLTLPDGSQQSITPTGSDRSSELADPSDNTLSHYSGSAKAVTFPCKLPGQYELELDSGNSDSDITEAIEVSIAEATGTKDVKIEVSANILFRDESNLSGAEQGRWGEVQPPRGDSIDYYSATPALLLLGLIFAVLHGLLSRLRGGKIA